MYFYYRKYKLFIDEYPRFKTSSLSFDVLKLKISRISSWFKSTECIALTENSVNFNCSVVFWKDPSNHFVSPRDAFDLDFNLAYRTNNEGSFDDLEYVYRSESEEDSEDSEESEVRGMFDFIKASMNEFNDNSLNLNESLWYLF